jgi:hypothetical protein
MSSTPRQQERAVSKLMPEISVLDRFPRLPFTPQDVARIDIVMFDFPELVFVTRHGCEPVGAAGRES